MDKKISLVLSSIRPKLWKRFLESLVPNEIGLEVIFVGDRLPEANEMSLELANFSERFPHVTYKNIYSKVKPAQCYEIGFREATGELVHWTCDEAIYTSNALEQQYYFHKSFVTTNLVTGMSCIENGHKTSDFHHIGDNTTPRMMVYGFIDREYLYQLGGYDRRFITGQAENDICMRVLANGGQTAICEEARVTNNHEVDGIHGSESKFRKWHPDSRKFLEDCWFVKPNVMAKKRQIPFEPFEDKDIRTKSQEPCGEWV